ncbi:MAG TPA: patatin-like phospholipase family protein [bacterium]
MAQSSSTVSPGRASAETVMATEQEYLLTRRTDAGVTRQNAAAAAGLALSGGGIRSAAFSLGVLQAIAGAGLLKQFDYLSTVSGGGYIGTSLTWWWSGRAFPPGYDKASPRLAFGLGKDDFPYSTGSAVTLSSERDPDPSRVVEYLRRHGEYITPGDGLTLLSGIAAVMRGIVLNVPILIWAILAVLMLLTWGVDRLAEWFPVLRDDLWTPAAAWINCHIPLLNAAPTVKGLCVIGGKCDTVDRQVVIPLLYPALFALGLLLAASFLAVCVVYAVISRAAAARQEEYTFRRDIEKLAGWMLVPIAVLCAVGLLPFLYWNLHPIVAAAVPLVSSAAGVIGGLWRYLVPAGRNEKSYVLPLLLGAASVAALFALLWIAFWFGDVLYPYNPPGHPGWSPLIVTVVVAAFAFSVNLNHISLHRFYRDRLMEAFHPNWETARDNATAEADRADGMRLHDLADPAAPGAVRGRPYPLVNTNVVLVDSDRRTSSQRGGDSFILSPAYCGSDATGWHSTRDFIGGYMTLSTAMAISGAAANPNAVGAMRDRLVSILMNILNLRLGFWALNPNCRFLGWTRRPNHLMPGVPQIIFPKSLGLHERAPFLQLSDGGHFENLALYELIRRKTRLIVLCDGGMDEEYTFQDLRLAIRLIAEDFEAELQFAEAARPESLRPIEQDKETGRVTKPAARGHLLASIKYADGTSGTLIYLKPTLIAGLPLVVTGYHQDHTDFPNQTTADQWFDEEQFEAYRQLGHALATQMLKDTQLDEKLAAL